MKFVRYLFVALSIILIPIFVYVLFYKPADSTHVDSPMMLEDALVTFTISDLHGFLDGAGTVVEQFSPMMNASTLKMMLGQKLGDSQFEGFVPEKGFSVVVLNASNTFAVLEIEAAMVETYTQNLQAIGLLAERVAGLVLVSKTSEPLTHARRLAKTVQADLLAQRSSAIQMVFHPELLFSKNKTQTEAELQKILLQMQQVSSSNTTLHVEKIMEAELRLLLSIGSQIDAMKVAIEPSNGSIKMSEVIEPVKGSRLAALFKAPSIRDFNPDLQVGVLSGGAIDIEYCLRNPKAISTFFIGECKALFEAMQLDEERVDPYIEYLNSWMNIMGGTVCESILTGSSKKLGAAYLADVTDEAATLEKFRNLQADMTELGIFDLYESMGIPMSFEFKENVREHAGVKIHQLKENLSLESLSVEERVMMESMLGDLTCDIAIYKGTLLCSMGEEKLENMMDQMKDSNAPPLPLTARLVSPEGGFCYADIDVGKCVSFINAIIPNTADTFGPLVEILTGADPITIFSSCHNGRLETLSEIPGGLLVRIAQVGQMMAMEAMKKKADMQAEQEEQTGR